MKEILVIDNHDSFVYNAVQLLQEDISAPAVTVVPNDRIDFYSLDRYRGILLSPGPGIPAEAGELLRLVRTCRETHPMLGICLGHQAIAQSFGARLYHLPRPLHGHRSRLRITDPHDPLFEGVREAIVGRYHSWAVSPENFPAELAVSSKDEENCIMSLYHPRFPVHGVQFHPESCISECGRLLIRNWLRQIP